MVMNFLVCWEHENVYSNLMVLFAIPLTCLILEVHLPYVSWPFHTVVMLGMF